MLYFSHTPISPISGEALCWLTCSENRWFTWSANSCISPSSPLEWQLGLGTSIPWLSKMAASVVSGDKVEVRDGDAGSKSRKSRQKASFNNPRYLSPHLYSLFSSSPSDGSQTSCTPSMPSHAQTQTACNLNKAKMFTCHAGQTAQNHSVIVSRDTMLFNIAVNSHWHW